MNQPLVSILMTVYNREKYIAEAIESVLASTYTNFELIIVDDCSKDNSVTIAQSYARKDSRIRLYVNEKNLGDYPNRNKASSYAKGEYIMFVDSDDKIFPDGFSNCVEAMLSFPHASFGMMDWQSIGKPYTLVSEQAIKNHFFKKPFLTIGPGGTIIKRSFFEHIGKYPELYGPANDMYFNLKATAQSEIVMLPFEFMYYRRHEGQEINNTYAYMYNNYLYLQDALLELPLGLNQSEIQWLQKKNKRRFAFNIIKYFFKNGDIGKTWDAIQKTKFTFKDFMIAVVQ
ncbi:MAG: glycosyltransferase family 2 protein [Saprospiraceae bacterium]